MSNPSPSWLLAENKEPAAELADHLLSRRQLVPPISVDRLVEEVAHVEEHPWPHGCDAVVVGLISPQRPTIFLKSHLPRRRRRFTLAHELGHIEMGWHIGEMACTPRGDAFEVEALQPAAAGIDVLAGRRIREQEAEATRFASYLLMPERWLRALVDSRDVRELLRGAKTADVSVQAYLMRLKSIL